MTTNGSGDPFAIWVHGRALLRSPEVRAILIPRCFLMPGAARTVPVQYCAVHRIGPQT
jgi:hypothetical protein